MQVQVHGQTQVQVHTNSQFRDNRDSDIYTGSRIVVNAQAAIIDRIVGDARLVIIRRRPHSMYYPLKFIIRR